MSESRAVQRLLRDLKELQESPLLNVAAEPLEDNLLIWHVNLRGLQAPLSDGVFHLIITFSSNYPTVPPSVDLCTTIPHANVFANKHGKKNHICLDMLEDGDFSAEEDKNRAYTGWSSSYSLLSLLTQLQSFLMAENLHYGSNVSVDDAVREAKGFHCKGCPHTGTKPWPRFNEKAGEKKKLVVRKPHIIVPSILEIQASKKEQAALPTPVVSSQTPQSQPQAKVATPAPAVAAVNVASTKAVVHEEKKKVVAVKPQQEEWQVVSSRKKKKKDDFVPQSKKPAVAVSKSSWKAALNQPIVEEKEAPKEVKKANKKEGKPTIAVEVKKKSLIPGELYDDGKKKKSKNARRKKSNNKNEQKEKPEEKKKEEKKEEQKKEEEKEEEKEESDKESEEAEEEKQEEDSFVTVGKKKDNHEPTVVDHKSQTHSPGKGDLVLVTKENVNRKPQIGDLGKLPYEILLEVFSYLGVKDVARLSSACKDLRSIAEDGFLWKSLFSKYYPSSSLTAENVKDWKFVFMCEVNNILADLVCFHTKKNFEEDILGIPIEFTLNPKTEKIDYIYSSMDLLSWEAFHQDKVRKTAWKETFTHWLPLYITQEHFQRALPLLKKTFLQLCPHYHTNTFQPEMALEILCKLMNTQCVLLMDKGVHASSKALDGYFAIHRLMIAFITEFPQLSVKVDKQIGTFIQTPSSRTKSELPALGEFLPLLSVCRKFTWYHIAKPFLEELFDRNVIWICKQQASLASGLDRKDVDLDRLTKSFEAVHVSLRLIMFHVYFLTEIARPKAGKIPLEQVALDYDRFYGRPSHQLRDKFQNHVKRILNTKIWPEFFNLIRFPCPNQLDLSNWLRQSVRNSKRKGYHSDSTNFSAIQKSGVSKILLKGESYTASPTLRNVLLEEVWGYPNSTIFLDASCLVYDDKHNYLAPVDYSVDYHNGAITHSGDVIDYNKKEGKHTIRIDLKLLPANITNLYITITAFTTTLKDIKRPYIRFTDADLDQELCRYDLESIDTGSHTAIVMAKLCRPNPKEPWKVLALGEICDGRASNYAPLLTTIQSKLATKN